MIGSDDNLAARLHPDPVESGHSFEERHRGSRWPPKRLDDRGDPVSHQIGNRDVLASDGIIEPRLASNTACRAAQQDLRAAVGPKILGGPEGLIGAVGLGDHRSSGLTVT